MNRTYGAVAPFIRRITHRLYITAKHTLSIALEHVQEIMTSLMCSSIRV
jgi:hypothetical protein|nr:MAG TPA: hypothetical protein [Caudoviricetes sp.]